MLQVAFSNMLTAFRGEKWEKAWLDFQKGIDSPLEGWYTTAVNISALWSRRKWQYVTQTPPSWIVKEDFVG